MSKRPQSTETGSRKRHGPSGAWSLWIVIPLDVIGLSLVLAALNWIPRSWPAPPIDAWMTLTAAVALFALARAVALIALRRLLHWRVASDSWRRVAASYRSRLH
jgi:hypothetical protein